jgi:hypothetical protein
MQLINISKILDFLRSQEPPISAIVGILTIIGILYGVGHWLFSHPSPPSLQPSITAHEHNITAGGDITATAQSGDTAIIATGNVTVGAREAIQTPSPAPELQQPQLAQTPITGGEQPAQPSLPLKSFEAYCNRVRDLEGRFFERDEFLDSMIGKEVEWMGFVFNLTPLKISGDMILTILQHTNMADRNCMSSFRFSDKQLYTKLNVLRPNDKVQVTGVYEEASSWNPYCKGKNFKRLDN